MISHMKTTEAEGAVSDAERSAAEKAQAARAPFVRLMYEILKARETNPNSDTVCLRSLTNTHSSP